METEVTSSKMADGSGSCTCTLMGYQKASLYYFCVIADSESIYWSNWLIAGSWTSTKMSGPNGIASCRLIRPDLWVIMQNHIHFINSTEGSIMQRTYKVQCSAVTRGMGCLLWVQSLIYVLLLRWQYCVQYYDILYRVITKPHCSTINLPNFGAGSVLYITHCPCENCIIPKQ